MRTITWRVSIILLLLSVGLMKGAVSPAAASSIAITDTGNPPLGNPVTDGQYVAWLDSQNILHVMTIQNSSLVNPRIFPVKGHPITNSLQADAGYATWYNQEPCPDCGKYVYVIDLATGQQTLIGNGEKPSISGHSVAYISPTPTSTIVSVRDVSTMAAPVIFTRTIEATNVAIDTVAGEIAWTHPFDTGQGKLSYILYTQALNGFGFTSLSMYAGPVRGLDFRNGILLFSGGSSFFAYNTSNQIIHISDVNGGGHPITDGRYVYWDDNNLSPGQNAPVNLHAFDLQTRSSFDVVVNKGANEFPYARNGYIVWGSGTVGANNTFNQTSIQFASITDTLPTARQPQTASTPDQNYFSQTGHTLSFGFKYFWEHGGGLPVFGFPLTQEFTELNPDNSQNYTVQYFERQRYEYHPEFKGTPYETELGRLGAADALQRNLYNRVPTAFPAAPKSSDPNCTYFPQTQHNICGSFGAYWHTHGLEFGDAGVSFREAVALFGYPISEQFKDPDSGLMVQYFERARFEHQPQFVGTPNEVELGLLGQQVLRLHGWPL